MEKSNINIYRMPLSQRAKDYYHQRYINDEEFKQKIKDVSKKYYIEHKEQILKDKKDYYQMKKTGDDAK